MAASRTLKLTYLGDASNLSKTTNKAGDDVATLGQRVGKVGKAIGVAFLAVGAAGIAMGKKLFDAFEEVTTANARIEAVVTSMGNFAGEIDGVTQRLVDQAEATARLTGVDRNLIKESQALLLTFDSVNKTAGDVGGVFDRATQAAVDLAAAGFGEVNTNAIQLGKALEDPIKGLTALGRSGVTFTDEQRELIKSLVESNRTLEAQGLILGAIEKQVGGVAEATANGSARMSQAFGILTEQVASALAPAFEKLVDFGLQFVDKVAVWWNENGDDVIRRFGEFRDVIVDVSKKAVEFARAFIEDVKTATVDSVKNVNGIKDAFEDLRQSMAVGFTGDSGIGNRVRVSMVESISLMTTDLGYLLEGVIRSVTFVKDAFNELPNNLAMVGNDLVPVINFIIRQFNVLNSLANDTLDLLNRIPGVDIPAVKLLEELERDPFDVRDPMQSRSQQTDRSGIGLGAGQRAPGNVVNITVQGAIDPEGTARTIQRTLNDSRLRAGPLTAPGGGFGGIV